MWLREGWIWDHITGDKHRATAEEMQKAEQGEMEITDPQERKFAAQAAGVPVSPAKKDEVGEGGADSVSEERSESSSSAVDDVPGASSSDSEPKEVNVEVSDSLSESRDVKSDSSSERELRSDSSSPSWAGAAETAGSGTVVALGVAASSEFSEDAAGPSSGSSSCGGGQGVEGALSP